MDREGGGEVLLSTDNRSVLYNEDRNFVRRWLDGDDDGRFALELTQRDTHASALRPERKDAGDVLTNDQHFDFSSFYDEHRHDLAVAYNCREAREAFRIDARTGERTWVRFFQCPGWLFFRRQIENMDPEYWNDPKNVFREALAFPEFCTVPADRIRGEYERYLGKAQTRLIIAPEEAGLGPRLLPAPGYATPLVGSQSDLELQRPVPALRPVEDQGAELDVSRGTQGVDDRQVV